MPRTRAIGWAQLKLGVVGLVAAGLLAVMVFAVSGQAGFPWQRYSLKARFNTIEGLKTGAVVRLSGKEVGKVTSIEFAGKQIEVVFELSRDIRGLVTTDSTAVIGSLSLLGEPIVDLTASDCGTALEEWAYVPTGVGGGPIGTLTTSASNSLNQAGGMISDLRAGRGTVGKLMTDDSLYTDLHAFVASASDIAKQIRTGKGTLGQLTKDPAAYQSLKRSLDNFEALTDRLTRGEGTLGRLLTDGRVENSLASAAANTDVITGRLARGEGTAGKLLTDNELYARLNDVSARVDQVVAGLDAGRGTAGQLLRDRELYDNMNGAVKELRALLSDIRKDPKKYLRVSVSIF